MAFLRFRATPHAASRVVLSAEHRVRLERAAAYIDRNPCALADDLATRLRALARYEGPDPRRAIRQCVFPPDELWFASQLRATQTLRSVFHSTGGGMSAEFSRRLADRMRSCEDAQRLIGELTGLIRQGRGAVELV